MLRLQPGSATPQRDLQTRKLLADAAVLERRLEVAECDDPVPGKRRGPVRVDAAELDETPEEPGNGGRGGGSISAGPSMMMSRSVWWSEAGRFVSSATAFRRTRSVSRVQFGSARPGEIGGETAPGGRFRRLAANLGIGAELAKQ